MSELLKESAKLYDLDPHSHNKNLMLMIFLMEQMIYHEHLSGNIRPLVCLLLVGYNHGCMKSPITLKKDTTSMLTSSSWWGTKHLRSLNSSTTIKTTYLMELMMDWKEATFLLCRTHKTYWIKSTILKSNGPSPPH